MHARNSSQVSGGGGGKLWLSETEVQGKFKMGGGGGGLTWNAVEVCHLGLSGGMFPRNIFNFKPSEMAANAFKTNMGWYKLIYFQQQKKSP